MTKKILILNFLLIFIFSLSSCEKTENKEIVNNLEQKIQNNNTIKEKEEKTKTWSTEKSNSGTLEETKTWALEKTSSWTTEKTQTWAIQEEKVKDKEIEKQENKKETPKIVSQKTMLIFDASGSMWGKIDWKTKIEIARKVIKKTLSNFEETELGLMAYGHRKKWDCEDIEILTEPTKNNWDKISNFVDKIVPKWMTPMWDSVMKAAENLKYSEQKATIILVSDWIETCWVDLCALWKKLEETWVDFTAHVIGFDMSEKQVTWLKCLAQETWWTFTSAKNADDLWKALKKTVEAASCSKEKLWESIITAPKKVNAGSKFEILYTWPKNNNDYVAVITKGSTDTNDHLDYIYTKNKWTKLKAPNKIWEYDIVYIASCWTILWRTAFEVVDVIANVTAPESVWAGSDFEISYTWPKNDTDIISILPKGSTDKNKHLNYIYPKNNWNKIKAPNEIWEYDLVYFLNNDREIFRTTFKVIEVTANITAPESVWAASKFEISFTWPKNSYDVIHILPKGSINTNQHLNYLYPKNNWNKMIAPVETWEYDLVYYLNWRKELTRTTFKVVEVSAKISWITKDIKKWENFEINWTWPNNDSDLISIMSKWSTNPNEHLDYIYPKNRGKQLRAPDKAWEYDIVYWLAQKKVLDRISFKVVE